MADAPLGAWMTQQEPAPQYPKQPASPPQEKKFCVQCATDLRLNFQGEWFCPNCGFKLAVSAPTPVNIKSQKRQTYLKIGMYVVGGAIAIFAVWFFFSKFQELLNLF